MSAKSGGTNRRWLKENGNNTKGLKIIHPEKVEISINNKRYTYGEYKDKESFFRKFFENYFSIIEKRKLFNESERSKKAK